MKRKFLASLLVWVVHISSALATGTSSLKVEKDFVQTVNHQNQSNVKMQKSDESITKVEVTKELKIIEDKTKSQEMATEAKLWNLYNQRKFTELNQFIAKKKMVQKNWEMPIELAEVLHAREVELAVAKAKKGKNDLNLFKLFKNNEDLFTCDKRAWRFALAEAYMRKKQLKHAVAEYHFLLDNCNFDAVFDALNHATMQLPKYELDKLFEYELALNLSANAKDRIEKLYHYELLKRAKYASEIKEHQNALELADALTPILIERHDYDGVEQLAWLYFEEAHYTEALKLFSLAQHRITNFNLNHGIALCLLAMKDFNQLDAYLTLHHDEFIQHKAIKDFIPALAGYKIQQESYAESLAYLRDLESLGALADSELEMKSWSLYHLGEFQEASIGFEALYRKQHDVNTAKGLFYSLMRLNKQDDLLLLAEALGGELLVLVDEAFSKNSVASDTGENVLAEPDASYVRTAYLSKNRKGNNILDGMHLGKKVIEGAIPFSETSSLTARVEDVTIANGTRYFPDVFNATLPSDPGYEVGTMDATGLTNYTIPMLPSSLSAKEWRLGYTDELDQANWSMHIGQVVPSASKVKSSKIYLDSSYATDVADGHLNVNAYINKPLRESVLSYMGMTDPYLGVKHWGQVRRSGISVAGYKPIGNHFTLGGSITTEVRNGYDVATNKFASAYLALNVSPEVAGMQLFYFGPYLRGEKSANNQNHYTYGHGGYYSPQQLTDLGLTFSLEKKVNENILFSFSGGVGYQNAKEGAAPYFPMNNNVNLVVSPRVYSENTSKGSHYYLNMFAGISLTTKLKAHLQFNRSSSISGDTSTAYKEDLFALGLTYYFDNQGDVLMRADLPKQSFSALY